MSQRDIEKARAEYRNTHPVEMVSELQSALTASQAREERLTKAGEQLADAAELRAFLDDFKRRHGLG